MFTTLLLSGRHSFERPREFHSTRWNVEPSICLFSRKLNFYSVRTLVTAIVSYNTN